MRTLGTAMTVLSAACLAATALIYFLLKEDVRRLEERITLADAARPPADHAVPERDLPGSAAAPEPLAREIEARLEALDRALAALERRASAAAEGIPAGSAVSAAAPGQGGKGTAGGAASGPEGEGTRPEGSATEAELRKKIENLESSLRKVENRLEDNKDEKPKLERFAAMLELDEEQTKKTREILTRGQEESLELLKRPLPDGTVFAEEIAEHFAASASGDTKGNEKMLKVFGRLYSEKVPGTDKTFIQVMDEGNARMTEDLGRIMTPEQGKKFRQWAVKPSDVELGNGPFERYILEWIKNRPSQTK
jgi:hypothetical protein